jgi:hypothetical protein
VSSTGKARAPYSFLVVDRERMSRDDRGPRFLIGVALLAVIAVFAAVLMVVLGALGPGRLSAVGHRTRAFPPVGGRE